MRNLLITAALFCTVVNISAQVFKPADGFHRSFSPPYEDEYLRNMPIGIDYGELEKVVSDAAAAMELVLPLADRTDKIAELTRTNPFSNDYEVRVGGQLYDFEQGIHYAGTIKGHAGKVFVSAYRDAIYVSGEIDGVDFKINNGYTVMMTGGFECHADDMHIIEEGVWTPGMLPVQGAPAKCVNVHVEVTSALRFRFVSATATIQYIESLMNAVSTIYQQQAVPSGVVLSFVNVWTSCGDDPWCDAQTANDHLDDASAYAQANGINGDVLHVLDTYGLGGVAYLNVLNPTVSNQFKVGYSSINGVFNNNLSSYSWDPDVVCHELGHNIGSYHTHACVWNGNNTQIDDCGNKYYLDRGLTPEGVLCFDENDMILPGKGTIMSYCHLINGTNLTMEDQVAQLMATRISQYGSECSTTCPGTSPQASNITGSSATISWPTIPDAVAYEVSLAGTTQVTTSTSVTFTGLESNTDYLAIVVTDCGGGEKSFGSTVAFATGCGEAVTIGAGGYAEDFEGAASGWGVFKSTETSLTTWERGAPSGIPASPNGGSIYATNLSGNYIENEAGYVRTPCFDFSGVGNGWTMRFEYYTITEKDWDGTQVRYTTDGKNWHVLGQPQSVYGPDNQWVGGWYNDADVQSLFNTPGWSGPGEINSPAPAIQWREGWFATDIFAGQPNVSFAFLFRSDVVFSDWYGFAFDNFRIVPENVECEDEFVTVEANTCDPAEAGTTIDSVAVGDCWKVTTTNTTLRPSYDIEIEKTTCNNAEVGTVVESFTTAYGCDSTITTTTTYSATDTIYLDTLTVTEIDTVIQTVYDTIYITEIDTFYITDTIYVTSGSEEYLVSEDAMEEPDGDVKTSDTELKFGKDRDVGLRFAVPENITRAYLVITANRDKTGSPSSVRITAEDNANPAPFVQSSGTYGLTSRSVISEYVDWTFGPWSEDGQYQSPDIAHLIKHDEVVFILKHTGSQERKAYSMEGSIAQSVKLVSEYETVGPDCIINRPTQRIYETRYEVIETEKIHAWPNPTSGNLTVEGLWNADYIIVDALGRQVAEGITNGAEVVLDLDPGVYRFVSGKHSFQIVIAR